MKKILLSIFMIIVTAGCFDKTPTCSDEDVKELAAQIYKDYVKESIKEVEQYKSAMSMFGLNINELKSYFVMNKNMTPEEADLIVYFLQLDEDSVDKLHITIDNILSTNIDKSIKKCSCRATFKVQDFIKNKQFEKEFDYTAQLSDDKKHIYVELLSNDN